jgi:hypothetical protein
MTGPSTASRSAQRPPALAAVGLDGPESSPAGGLQLEPPFAKLDDVAVLLLVDVAPGARLWGWSRIVLGARPLRGVPGLRLAKALGSGHQGGFGLRPSPSRQGLFTLFSSERHADDFIRCSPVVAGYRERAREFLLVKLRATSCRGTWSGASVRVSATVPTAGPVAALTRASIRPTRAWSFWRHSPASEAALAAAAGCQLAVGLGEAPVLRQATFSVWESQASMDAYARSGAHLQAIRGALAGDWFSESMFVRFVPQLMQGRWQGRDYG